MPVRSGGGCVKYLISAGPSLCVRQWMAANSLIRSLSSPRRDIPCPSIRLFPVRLRLQLCRPHFRAALLLFTRIVLFIYIFLLHRISHALRVHFVLFPFFFAHSFVSFSLFLILNVRPALRFFLYHFTFNYRYIYTWERVCVNLKIPCVLKIIICLSKTIYSDTRTIYVYLGGVFTTEFRK